MSRKFRSLALVLVLMVGYVVWAGPASNAYALGCGPGLFTTGAGLCIDPLTGTGSAPVGGAVPPARPRVLSVPASQEVAVQNPASSLKQKVGTVAVDAERGGGKLMVGKAIPVVGSVLLAADLGYELGNVGVGFACGTLGISALCRPHISSTVVPNSDVTVDTGWTGQAATWCQTTGSGGGCLGDSSGALISMTWDLSVVPTLGAFGSGSPTGGSDVLDLNATGAPSGEVNPNSSVTLRPYCKSQSDGSIVASAGTYSSYRIRGNQTPNNAAFVGPLGSPDTVACGPGNPYGTGAGWVFDHYTLTADGNTNFPLTNWFPVGHTSRPAGTGSDPVRNWSASNDCTGVGGTVSHVTSTSADFHESDAEFPPFPVPGACPAGTTLSGTTITELTTGGSTRTVWSYIVPPAVVESRQAYPECAGGTCKLGLWKLSPATSSCFVSDGLCEGWFSDPSKLTDYQCTYGPSGGFGDTHVALSECNAYAPTFDALKQAAGVPYADPATGVSPDTMTDTDPTTDPALPGAGGASCYPTGWGAFNPVSWVLMPIKCALVWAFVPDSGSITDFVTTVRTAYDGTAMGEWFAAIGGVGHVVVPSGDCNGVTMHWPSVVGTGPGQDLHLFATCDPPWSVIAGIVKSFLILMIVWGTGLAVFRNVASAFGYEPKFGEKQ